MKKLAIILSTLFVFSILNYSIYHKEKILISGEEIFLALVPVDPRSLIQGDYMQLGYAIENTAKNNLIHAPKERGDIVITLDNKKIAHFDRFKDNHPLKNNEKLIRYTFDKNHFFRPIQIQPNSFFFQEGQGAYFAKAKYAIFHYNGIKEYVLVGLADENGKKIEPPKTKLFEKNKSL